MPRQQLGLYARLTILDCLLIAYLKRFGTIYAGGVRQIAQLLGVAPEQIFEALERLAQCRLVQVIKH
jgi:Mn-dependent DtxR family transcriptional regulator